MKIKSQHPFSKYAAYKIYHKKMGRWQVCLVSNNGKERTTITYAKYLMSVKEGRFLARHEEVDHINGDKEDDRIENLQIITRKENFRKYAKTLTRCVLKLTCPECSKEFSRERRNTHFVKGGFNTFCSRKCSGKFTGFKNKTN